MSQSSEVQEFKQIIFMSLKYQCADTIGSYESDIVKLYIFLENDQSHSVVSFAKIFRRGLHLHSELWKPCMSCVCCMHVGLLFTFKNFSETVQEMLDPGGGEHLYFRLDIILVKGLSKHTLNTYFQVRP